MAKFALPREQTFTSPLDQLYRAVTYNNVSLVTKLIETHGAEVAGARDGSRRDDVTLLHRAVSLGQIEVR